MAEGNQKKIIFNSLFPRALLGKKKREREREREKEGRRDRERERETRQGGLTDMHTNYAIKKDPITLEEPQCII